MATTILNDSPETANKMPEDGDIETLRKKHVVRGLSGFVNLGSSCYLAASLQCLVATDELVAYVRGTGQHGKYKPYLKNSVIKRIADEEKKKGKLGKVTVNVKDVRELFREELAYKLRNVIVVYWGVNCKIKPIAFKQKIGQLDSIYRGPVQNDAQECVNFILDNFHEGTKSDVIIETRDVPEQILKYNEVKSKYTELINSETLTGEDKVKVLDEYRQYKLAHLKEDAGLGAIEYWQKFIRKNHSVIVDLFYGLELSEVKCNTCNNVNLTHTSYTSIAVQIPNKQQQKPANKWYNNWHGNQYCNGWKGVQTRHQLHMAEAKEKEEDENDNSVENKKELTLYECLNATLNVSEILSGENQLTCDVCMTKRDVTKTTTLWHCPPRLILHLKRFINIPIPNTYHTRQEKVEKLVKFPITGLSMKDYMSEHIADECIYDLYAVIHQSGSLSGGHYVAYTKNLINGFWYYYNDQNVKRVKPEEVEEKLVSNQAYILFYEKRGNVDIASGFSSDDESDTEEN
jgi:ubiquitin C-terminal hydrolase